MADLITLARARAALDAGQLSLSAEEIDTLESLIAAASAAAESLCRRRFSPADRDELYHGTGGGLLTLRHYPVASVSRVLGRPTPVLSVVNTAAGVGRATARVTDDGLELARVSGATTTTDTVLFADAATVGDLADDISAAGNGWGAAADTAFAHLPSADLRGPQGAFGALGAPARLVMHVEELADFRIDAEAGGLRRGASPSPFFGGDEYHVGPAWRRGLFNYRVVYRSGYAEVPADVQEAVAQWAAALFWRTKADPAAAEDDPPAGARALLAPYRRWTL